ncbi:MAG: bifunctional precorrin-2 dehydrogenase/sirohydrochlorin ferrochelatase [Ilumatobacteraceae bacterium]
MAHVTQFSYPVFLDLAGVPVLVVGAGPIGVRKAEALQQAGARVRVVATALDEAFDRDRYDDVRERPFQKDDLDGMRLVITATGDAAVDAAVSAAARARGIWTNAADQPVDCEFILPSIARSGRVTVAVSTDGASPALAKALRDRIATMVGDEVAALAEELAEARAAVKAGGGSTEDVDWSIMIERVLGGVDTE